MHHRKRPAWGAAWGGRRLGVALLMAGLLSASGCGVAFKQAGRATTEGALEALEEVRQQEQQALMETGAKTGQGVTRGIMQELAEPEQRQRIAEFVSLTVSQTLLGLAEPVGTTLPTTMPTMPATQAAENLPAESATTPTPMADTDWRSELEGTAEQLAGQVAQAFTRELSAELTRQLGTNGDGPLARSLAGTAGELMRESLRSGSAEVRTLMPELELEGELQLADLEASLQRFSYAAALGAAEGLRERSGLWPMLLTFVLGVAVGLVAVAVALVILRSRQANHAA